MTSVRLDIIKELLPEQGVCGNVSAPPVNDAFRVLSRLTAPEGVTVRPQGGGSGGGQASSVTTLTGDALSIDSLLPFYIDELSAADWEIIESDSAGNDGWLSARFTDGEDTGWLATLTLLQHPTHADEFSAVLTVFAE